MRTLPAMLILLAVALALPPDIGAADPVAARGSALGNACAACHGPNGRSQGAIPTIDTLSSADFAVALQAFRANTRKGTVMNLIAKGLDDADIEAVATYFATLRRH